MAFRKIIQIFLGDPEIKAELALRRALKARRNGSWEVDHHAPDALVREAEKQHLNNLDVVPHDVVLKDEDPLLKNLNRYVGGPQQGESEGTAEPPEAKQVKEENPPGTGALYLLLCLLTTSGWWRGLGGDTTDASPIEVARAALVRLEALMPSWLAVELVPTAFALLEFRLDQLEAMGNTSAETVGSLLSAFRSSLVRAALVFGVRCLVPRWVFVVVSVVRSWRRLG